MNKKRLLKVLLVVGFMSLLTSCVTVEVTTPTGEEPEQTQPNNNNQQTPQNNDNDNGSTEPNDTEAPEQNNNEGQDTGEINTDTNPQGNDDPQPNLGEDDSEIEVIISLNKKELDLVNGKSEYLTVSFPDGYQYDPEGGSWNTSDPSIVEVSQYGKVTAKGVGSAYVTYTASTGVTSGKCVIYVNESQTTIQRVWNKVTDVESIKNGDIIVFACPQFGVAASLDRKDGYLLPTKTIFNSDYSQITELGLNACEFFVGATDEKDIFTLETQDGLYLAGKNTVKGGGISFVKSKGQINWLFERPEGYNQDYCVNADIADDLWLMFNKINNDDIRFNLYDSNETQLMKLATFYRREIVH